MKYPSLIVAGLLIALSGCTTILDATTDQPIQVDPGKRSFGSYIDDQKAGNGDRRQSTQKQP